jgi:hypothetical protein
VHSLDLHMKTVDPSTGFLWIGVNPDALGYFGDEAEVYEHMTTTAMKGRHLTLQSA